MDAREAIPEVLKLLKGPDARVRADAAGFLGVKEAVLEIKKLLKDAEPSMRDQAATSLCLLGAPDTVGAMLEMCGRAGADRYNSYFLKAVREAATWQRLRWKFLPRALEGQRQEVLREVVRQAGLKLEFVGVDEACKSKRARVPYHGGHTSMNLALIHAVEAFDMDREFILEPDRVRILPCDKALGFWREWRARQQK